MLKAIISMRLMPRADGKGRVPAVEVLVATQFIRDCIENKEKTKQIKDAIEAGTSQYGMQSFDQSLFFLWKKQLITYEEALKRATNPGEFKMRVQGIQSTASMAQEAMEESYSDNIVGGGEDTGGAGDEDVFDFSNQSRS